MEKLELKRNDAARAIKTLKDVLDAPFTDIVRDAAIQRFEYTFEVFWKYVKCYLMEVEKIVANSPKSCFRELFTLSVTSEDETVKLLEMIDDRNRTSHTYNEDIANDIYKRIGGYCVLMNELMTRLGKRA